MQGLQKIHAKVKLPHRKTKKKPLIKEQKQDNQKLASQRAVVENVIGLWSYFYSAANYNRPILY
ncbi:transposase family protein [Wolbachia pipientis]|uniref:transposase family protein n=1 Tax=Wolbachia pipientis TaxID=955 RepID=UPI0036F2C9D8